jgi:3-oxoacyl-[acyl-carrier protein] reductase
MTAPKYLASAFGSLSVFNRVGTVEDVAALVRYLASPPARWTTGQVLDVTGGSAI